MIKATGSLYHRLFVLAVVLKGLNGVLELAAGASMLAIGRAGLNRIVTLLTARELSEDPTDLVATLLRRWFAQMSPDAELFAAVCRSLTPDRDRCPDQIRQNRVQMLDAICGPPTKPFYSSSKPFSLPRAA